MAFFAKHSLIRTVYLYLFALVGLALVVIGAVRLLDLGMKIYIFKEADKPESMRSTPPYPPFGILEPQPVKRDQGIGQIRISEKTEKLTPDEKAALDQWLVEYQAWQEAQKNIDYLRASREREASNSLAFMIIGLPLYLYHWAVIGRERKREENA